MGAAPPHACPSLPTSSLGAAGLLAAPPHAPDHAPAPPLRPRCRQQSWEYWDDALEELQKQAKMHSERRSARLSGEAPAAGARCASWLAAMEQVDERAEEEEEQGEEASERWAAGAGSYGGWGPPPEQNDEEVAEEEEAAPAPPPAASDDEPAPASARSEPRSPEESIVLEGSARAPGSAEDVMEFPLGAAS